MAHSNDEAWIAKYCIAVFLFVFSVPFPASAEIPVWFGKRDAVAIHEHETVGFGEGNSLAEANKDARAAIAAQLSVTVKTETRNKVVIADGNVEQNASRKIEERSDARLSNVQARRHDVIGNRHFVALAYDRRSWIEKLVAVPKTKGSSCSKVPANEYLIGTSLFEEISGQFDGCVPRLILSHSDGFPTLAIGEMRVQLTPEEFSRVFRSIELNELKLSFLPGKSLRHGDKYRIGIDFEKGVHKGAYLSLLQVADNGIVVRHFGPDRIEAASKIVEWPDSAKYEGLEAISLDDRPVSFDMTIALICPHKPDFSMFEVVGLNTATGGGSGFSDLLDIAKGCRMTTGVTQTWSR